ncbi:hypothetical protein NYS52_18165 [Curtobacterium flaccumfaciens pv. flaccumfaciens]|uniref:hypothetical protein n=1 Tax=Curtobacterium poinsettiae TaxID=159612 RepID=UPI00217E77D9|nr:hypothetical protein [Curtobacterium flaccumfaciens]MCS6576457.1 hypothetical protein [Curtobacterium flaccumfaciens pv. flaccumfaciens]
MTTITVTHPRFWWRGTSADLRAWVDEDPDLSDRLSGPRWPDTMQQRWDYIAAAVADIGDELAQHAWTVNPMFPDNGDVTLTLPVALAPTEVKIVRAWFSNAEAVRVDPWWEQIENGRHRLWGTLPHFGARLIPVKGSAIGYANPLDAAAIGPTWPALAADNLQELDALNWFNQADPVNRTFRNALSAAAAGSFPSPV